MKYFKSCTDGYILGVGETDGNGNISEVEYNVLAEIIRNKPTPPGGHQYRLTTGVEWVLCEIPDICGLEEEITDTEALSILLGGAV